MKKIKINIIGSIFGSSGYDSHCRSLANALYKVADCKLTTQIPDANWVKHVNDAEMDMIKKQREKNDWNIIVAMPHQWKMFTGLGKNAGYCVWEGDRCPSSWCEEFNNNKINLIFTPSTHTKNAMLKTINESKLLKEEKETIINKIHIIPHGVDRKIFFKKNGI